MTCGHIRQEMPALTAEEAGYGIAVPAADLPCATPGCPDGVVGEGIKFMGPTPLHYLYLSRRSSVDGWRWETEYAHNSHCVPMAFGRGDMPVDKAGPR